MRILWVTPSLPHPQGTGGCVHEFEMIRSLSDDHEVHVVTSDPPDLSEGPVTDAAKSFTRVSWQARPYPLGKAHKATKLLVARPDLATWLKRDRLDALGKAMRSVVARVRIDATVVVHGEIAPVVQALDGGASMLYLFDSLTREIDRQLELGLTRRRSAQRRLERQRMVRYERRWYREPHRLAAVSSVDARWFEHLTGRPVETIENSVPDDFFEAPPPNTPSAVVSFIGTLNHPPNTDAIEWLVDDIWPRILSRRPDATLRVVGRGDRSGEVVARCRALVEKVDGSLHVDVDDVRPHYWASAVSIAPIRLGSGMRNKVAHSLACATPIVATPTALEGVDEELASTVLVGATADALAAHVVSVLDDRSAASRRISAARSPLDALRAESIGARLERALLDLCRSPIDPSST